MKYLLDTNICIQLIKEKTAPLLMHIQACKPGDVAVSSITVAELRYGAARSSMPEQNNIAIEKFLIPLEIIDFDYLAATEYGIIRSDLEKKGTPIGPMDNLIAAQAKCSNFILVTNNIKEFKRIPGLKIENWL